MMEKHVTLLAVLFIVYHAMGVLLGLSLFGILSGVGLLSREPEAVAVLSFIGSIAATFLLVFALPGLIAGFGMLKQANWARVLALVVAFFDLIHFPLGTALAIYAFWVLMQNETIEMFTGVTPPR